MANNSIPTDEEYEELRQKICARLVEAQAAEEAEEQTATKRLAETQKRVEDLKAARLLLILLVAVLSFVIFVQWSDNSGRQAIIDNLAVKASALQLNVDQLVVDFETLRGEVSRFSDTNWREVVPEVERLTVEIDSTITDLEADVSYVEEEANRRASMREQLP